MKFLNTPWRVEREPGELIVVDAKNMVVASFSLDDVPGTIEDEEQKAHALAALPGIMSAAHDFLKAMEDPVGATNEDLLLRLADGLELNLAAAAVPPPEKKKPEAKGGKVLG